MEKNGKKAEKSGILEKKSGKKRKKWKKMMACRHKRAPRLIHIDWREIGSRAVRPF